MGSMMGNLFRIGCGLVLGLVLLAAGGQVRAQSPPAALTVILDDDYPPYAFRDDNGGLQGILPDLWRAWSTRTGTPVRLVGLDWSEALRRFLAGQGDVIDTIFRTPPRERLYLFSPPYATIEVPLFVSADLSGIHDGATARGFAVGVKNGDACIDVLAEQGVKTFQRYPSYQALVDAAAAHEVKVFCMDKPPAVYLLSKKGVDAQFHTSPPLYSGHFHWAVRKGNDALFRRVEAGFARIPPGERQAIDDRWLGRTIRSLDDARRLRRILTAAAVLAAAAAALALWVWALRRKVEQQTRQLRVALSELASSERRFRTIFDNINDAIFIQEIETGAILMVNRRMEEIYGYEAGEACRLTIGQLSSGAPPYSQAEALDWCRRSSHQPQIFEWHARRKDGSLFWAEVGMRRAVIDESGERLLVLVRDITERKLAEKALQEKNWALERSNAQLEAFAYVASHDLREPLRNVTAFSALLARRLKDRLRSDEVEILDILVDGASRMDALVRDLLEVSRVGRGDQPFAPVDLAEVVSLACDSLRMQIQSVGARVEVPPALPVLTGNAAELTRVFMNLLANALKYRGPAPPVIAIRCTPESGGEWRIEVRDNGIGIERGQGYEERIFGLFQRLHRRAEYGGGTGIGLTICRKIVDHHGGRIRVESDGPGRGTTVIIILPGA